jgi:hypothetical protein
MDESAMAQKTYKVQVQTGTIKNADTDARVYIQLLGGKRMSPELRIDNRENNFERGKLDTFMLNHPLIFSSNISIT